jgi:flavorubredoxin
MCAHVPTGGDKEGAALLSSVELVAARSGASLELGEETSLKLIPCPTPRWPDLLVAYSPSDRLLFTSKLFSAHVRCGRGSTSPWRRHCVILAIIDEG